MKKNYIGITGFTEKIQVLDTMNFIKDINSKKNYMFGFLVSSKTINFTETKNKRYLNFKNFKELKELMKFSSNRENIVNMLHFNTSKRDFFEELKPLLLELGDCVEAIQFNLSFIEIEEYKKLRKEFPNIKFLFQLNEGLKKKYSIDFLRETLKDIEFEYILIDASGGRGKTFEPKTLKEIYETLELNKLNINVGIAGGLSGENVKETINELNKLNIDYFIDAESRLRDKISEATGDDVWNQEKVNKYMKNSNI